MTEKFEPVAWRMRVIFDDDQFGEWVPIPAEAARSWKDSKFYQVEGTFTAAQMRQARINALEEGAVAIAQILKTIGYADAVRALLAPPDGEKG